MIDFFSNPQNLGSTLTLIGSFYIVFGHLFGSGKEIYQRCFGDNDDMSTDLYVFLDRQRIEAIIGFAIISLGFLFQLLTKDVKYFGLIVAILAIIFPIILLISTNRRRQDIIKNDYFCKNGKPKKPWFINYITDTIKDLSVFLKSKTNLDLYYWIFLFLFIAGSIYSYQHKNIDGMLTNYILWITFIAILWYSKETYWLKQVQQRALNIQKEKESNKK